MASGEVVISHGRRKGSVRSPPTSQDTSLRPGQVAVLSEEEWRRLKSKAIAGSKGGQARKSDRHELHETSKRIVKNWENTIEGQRVKRLQAREVREEREEAERVKLDLEEAAFQAAKRKEAIQKAKTMLYYQTDRVKQFHRAAVLSEVLRERGEQIQYKKKRQDALKRQDEQYQLFQQEEREHGILADMKAAEERAAQRELVSNFQKIQISERAKLHAEVRQSALEEQKKLDLAVADFHTQRSALEVQQIEEKVALRGQLDKVMCDRVTCEQRKTQTEKAEEEERRIFADAKKKMTKLRKEKEIELFQQFQTHQQRMCDALQTQMQQASCEEDERIFKAVAEQAAKREEEERAKEKRFIRANQEIHGHMLEQMAEGERRRQKQIEMDQQLLKQRIIQDQKFHSQELEKSHNAAGEARDQQQYHLSQAAEAAHRKQAQREEDIKYTNRNTNLLKVEEEQFQEYAKTVISEAAGRGAPTKPLVSAARAGAGGGRGPVCPGKGGIRPSYQVVDSTGVELPTYHPKPLLKNTQKRMGFTW